MAETYKWKVLNQLVQRQSDGAFIPNDLENRDWRQFLADGGVATAADPLPTPTDILNDQRAGAVANLLTDATGSAKFVRAVLLTVLDEVNVIRALLPGPPAPRTITQFKNAVQAKINTGAAD